MNERLKVNQVFYLSLFYLELKMIIKGNSKDDYKTNSYLVYLLTFVLRETSQIFFCLLFT